MEIAEIKKSKECSECWICGSTKNVKILSIKAKKRTNISLSLCEKCREKICLTLEDEAIKEYEESELAKEFDLLGPTLH
ncbi:hypothetical protein [Clostridium coskatii]|uniref:Uncharacterized protein n=1 Tax=Clostridium coskatii TaxID=1705578 RepID=A0A166T0X4_9CLOT|nr:hypothetical protein [Clostridium coskatii]OAA93033.1 hypothetical protein WX73_00351 [Clostridium coskatii]OBR90776.1 hypothetical protein CLCOS_37510 [Clostridium coskatii]